MPVCSAVCHYHFICDYDVSMTAMIMVMSNVSDTIVLFETIPATSLVLLAVCLFIYFLCLFF